MIVLDENIPEDQRLLLRSWRVRAYQVGRDVGRAGFKDEQQIIPLLLKLRRPTFFTRDLGFFDAKLCHARYGVVCLAVEPDEAASFVRRVLRHPSCDTQAKRLARSMRVSQMGIRVVHLGGREETTAWEA
jgi:hypothetical protein